MTCQLSLGLMVCVLWRWAAAAAAARPSPWSCMDRWPTESKHLANVRNHGNSTLLCGPGLGFTQQRARTHHLDPWIFHTRPAVTQKCVFRLIPINQLVCLIVYLMTSCFISDSLSLYTHSHSDTTRIHHHVLLFLRWETPKLHCSWCVTLWSLAGSKAADINVARRPIVTQHLRIKLRHWEKSSVARWNFRMSHLVKSQFFIVIKVQLYNPSCPRPLQFSAWVGDNVQLLWQFSFLWDKLS